MGGGASKGPVRSVVVVGGGFAGSQAAMLICKGTNWNVTVVDPRESMHNNIQQLRAAVLPAYLELTLVPRQHIGATLVTGRATGYSATEVTVTLNDGKTSTLPYDYLIIATGSTASFPAKAGETTYTNADTTAAFAKVAEAIRGASKIAIIGGGPVGVEFAGEITSASQARQ